MVFLKLLILTVYFLSLNLIGAYALDLDKAKFYFLNNDYKSAIIEGEKAMAEEGQSSNLDELYYILGLSYLKDGNYLRASDIFEIILKEFKESSFKEEAKLGLGDTYFLRGYFDNARKCYKELIESNSKSKMLPILYYRLSQCAYKQGNIQEAKGYADKLKGIPLQSPEEMNNFNSCPISSDFYSVQVGSFSKPANADSLVKKLVAKGYDAYVEPIVAQDTRSFRVKAGHLKERKDAEDLAVKLNQDGYPTRICP